MLLLLGRLIIFGGLVVLLVLLVLSNLGAVYPPPPLPALERSQYDEHLLAVDRDALEDAYHHQVEFLFEGWMKDPTGQPGRALNGIRKAARAYVAAMDGAKVREDEIKAHPYQQP
jgi:hypothetical protein